jgi:hypothetical protein
MAVNIYDELVALQAQLTTLAALLTATQGRVEVLEKAAAKPAAQYAPVTYFRSSTMWDATLANRPALVQINPGSGPGPSADSLYVGLVPKCRAAGVPVFGYVHTKYATRPVAEVKADAIKHQQWYGVDGIFVDTVSTKPEHLAYYADLCAYLRSWGLKIVLNPGTAATDGLFKLADYVMCAETDAARYLAGTRPSWERNYSAKVWHCVHSCPADQMPAVVAKAKADGAGLIYVTPDLMPNPYDTIPAYLAALTAEIAK